MGEGKNATKKSLSKGSGGYRCMVKFIDAMPSKEEETRGWIDALTGTYESYSPSKAKGIVINEAVQRKLGSDGSTISPPKRLRSCWKRGPDENKNKGCVRDIIYMYIYIYI